MTLTIEIAANAAASSWTDLTSVIRLIDGSAHGQFGGSAHNCDVGTGTGFNLDDDAGTRSLPTKRVLRAIEDATTPDTVLFKGRVSDKNLARSARFDGDSKAFDTTADDNNAQVYGIPVDGWSRPAESGRARVRAALLAFANGSPRASTVIDRTTYVPNTNLVTMPKQRYDQTDLGGVIRDCAAAEGKQAFITVDDEMFYDVDTSNAYAATLSITDDGANESTSFSPIDPKGTQQGNEFFSGATLKYGVNGSVSALRPAAEAAHDYWRTVLQDSTTDVGKARGILATMLNNQSVEEETFSCVIKVPDTRVDRLKWGHTVSFRSAAAGVLTPRTLRVAELYWQPDGVGVYLGHVTLGVPRKLGRRVRSAPKPVAPPPPHDPTPVPIVSPTCLDNLLWSAGFTSGGGTVVGAGLLGVNAVAVEAVGSAGIAIANLSGAPWVLTDPSWTVVFTVKFNSHQLATSTGQGIDTGIDLTGGTTTYGFYVRFICNEAGAGSLISVRIGNAAPTDYPVVLVAGQIYTVMLTYGPAACYAAVDGVGNSGTTPDGTPNTLVVGGGLVEDLARVDFTVDVDTFCTIPVVVPPVEGQVVNEIVGTGNGVTTLFTTTYPYRPGSLTAYANDLPEFLLTETDPAAGTFTFDTAPFNTESIRVRYEGA